MAGSSSLALVLRPRDGLSSHHSCPSRTNVPASSSSPDSSRKRSGRSTQTRSQPRCGSAPSSGAALKTRPLEERLRRVLVRRGPRANAAIPARFRTSGRTHVSNSARSVRKREPARWRSSSRSPISLTLRPYLSGRVRIVATWDDVSRLALAMPEAVESTVRGNHAWKVKDKLFVWERPLPAERPRGARPRRAGWPDPRRAGGAPDRQGGLDRGRSVSFLHNSAFRRLSGRPDPPGRDQHGDPRGGRRRGVARAGAKAARRAV